MRRTRLGLLCSLLAAGAFACGSDGSDSSGPDGGGNGNPDASIEDVGDRLTYMDTLTIPPVDNDVPECCYDFGEISKNGAGTNDNALALLANNTLLMVAGVDLQAVLDESIESGDQVLLLNHVGLVGPDDDFRLDGLQGDFAAGTTYAEASAGTGSFVIDPSSYDGSGNALISMTGTMSSSVLTAGPDNFSFQIPFGSTVLNATVQEARVSGTATLSDSGASYTGGELSGYVLVDEFFEGLNAYAASCTCLGLTGDLFVKTDGEWDSDCVADAASKCPNDAGCAQIAGDELFAGEACPLIPNLIQGEADIDLDDDPAIYEGLSVGLQWTGQNAAIAP